MRHCLGSMGQKSVKPPVLPVPLTPLIGREQEITQVCTLLELPQARLVTLVGTGGVDKTRLALQVATRAHIAFPDIESQSN